MSLCALSCIERSRHNRMTAREIGLPHSMTDNLPAAAFHVHKQFYLSESPDNFLQSASAHIAFDGSRIDDEDKVGSLLWRSHFCEERRREKRCAEERKYAEKIEIGIWVLSSSIENGHDSSLPMSTNTPTHSKRLIWLKTKLFSEPEIFHSSVSLRLKHFVAVNLILPTTPSTIFWRI